MYGVDKLYIPQTLEEALQILDRDPEVMPLAGGTDILVKMRHKALKGVKLMSTEKLEALKGVREREDGVIEIGASCTFTFLANNEIVCRRIPMIRTAGLAMGGPQIQNVATIGGNVSNGATSADSAPSLFALDAILILHSVRGVRRVPIQEFYAGPGRVKKEPGELLVCIEIPHAGTTNWGGMYIKSSVRKAMDISTLGAAATCQLNADGTVSAASIALGVAGPTPLRCPEAEAFLVGKVPTEARMEEVADLVLQATNPRTSWRASKEFRIGLIRALSTRAFLGAYAAAKGEAK